MPCRVRGLAIFCVFFAAIAAGSCASTSRSRKPGESTSTDARQAVRAPMADDSISWFQTETSVYSTLPQGEITGRVVSASTGVPVPKGEVWIVYPNHRHTKRKVFADAEGHFGMKGLPDEFGTLYGAGEGFRTDSVRCRE